MKHTNGMAEEILITREYLSQMKKWLHAVGADVFKGKYKIK